MARRARQKAANRQQAAVQRAAGNVGRPNQDVAREQRAMAASIEPSALRLLVSTDQGARSVDPVATAVALHRGVLKLQGAVGAEARQRCTLVHEVLRDRPDTRVASGLTLCEVLGVAAVDVPVAAHDGALWVAGVLRSLGAVHDDGGVDLYARVSPLGLSRHDAADEIEAVCASVQSEDVVADDARPRLVLVAGGGWFDVWPPSAILASSFGFLAGQVADLVGEGLYAWLLGSDAAALAASGPDALPQMFGGVDIRAMVDTAAQRAGSDHPAVAGPVLLSMLAMTAQ